jgi:hypothetical protein
MLLLTMVVLQPKVNVIFIPSCYHLSHIKTRGRVDWDFFVSLPKRSDTSSDTKVAKVDKKKWFLGQKFVVDALAIVEGEDNSCQEICPSGLF